MRFTKVVLHPKVVIEAGEIQQARSLHHKAHEECFIANSVSFPVLHKPVLAEGNKSSKSKPDAT